MLAIALLSDIVALAAECDEAHRGQACQVPVLTKSADLGAAVLYAEGECLRVMIGTKGVDIGDPEPEVSSHVSPPLLFSNMDITRCQHHMCNITERIHTLANAVWRYNYLCGTPGKVKQEELVGDTTSSSPR